MTPLTCILLPPLVSPLQHVHEHVYNCIPFCVCSYIALFVHLEFELSNSALRPSCSAGDGCVCSAYKQTYHSERYSSTQSPATIRIQRRLYQCNANRGKNMELYLKCILIANWGCSRVFLRASRGALFNSA